MSVTATPLSRERLTTIDSLRGVAALAVMLGHIAAWCFARRDAPAVQSTIAVGVNNALALWGVGIFFVLSGFCIHLPTVRRGPLPLGPYVRRRFIRIYPPHLVCLVASAALAPLVVPALAPLGVSALGLPTVKFTVLHLLMVHSFSPTAFHSINTVLWSIAVEAQFYAAYPLILMARERVSMGVIVLSLFAFAVVCPALDRAIQEPTLLAHGSPGRLWEWTLGAWLAERWSARPLAPARFVPTAGIALAVLVYCGLIGSAPHGLIIGGLTIPWLLALVVDRIARTEHGGPRWLFWTGERSYSLYLFHPVAIALVLWAWGATGAPLVVQAALGIALSIAMMAASYQWIERPSIVWSKASTQRRLASEVVATPKASP